MADDLHNDPIWRQLRWIEAKLDSLGALVRDVQATVDKMTLILIGMQPGKATDLAIVIGSAQPTRGIDPMTSKKATGPAVNHPCLSEKGKAKPKMVMPGVTLTSPLPASMALQPLDASGAVVALTPADVVTGTLTSDNAGLTISAGADSLHWTGTIPANTARGTVANLAATLVGTIQGAPANLTASVAVTIDVPPSPVAVDLAITFS